MGKTLYFECNAGISGDMTVAALLDLGADENYLKEMLKSLPVSGFGVEVSRVKKVGIDCADFNVILDQENHDHDMEYLHGHDQDFECESNHSHEHGCCHHHDDNGFHHHEGEECCHHHDDNGFHHHEGEECCHHHDDNGCHHHEHRGIDEVKQIINESTISQRAKSLSLKIFDILAQAEAKAHGLSVNQVHFHEVGAVDSIVDIVATAVCLDNLDVDRVIVNGICEGQGTVRCAHGILPIPVPAVANIIEASGLPVSFMKTKGEFVTPTGAAILAATVTDRELPEKFTVKKIGLGAGKRNYDIASILRVMWIETDETEKDCRTTDKAIYKLESNIDDCTGEALGFVMERLLEAGARDVHYIPVYMKKNRPAYQLVVICIQDDVEKMENIIFENTTTIGIRKCKMERKVLEREIATIDTEWGKVRVKLCSGNNISKCYPEYEDVARVSREYGVPFQQVYSEIQRVAEKDK